MTPVVLPPVPGWAPGVRALADAVEATGHRLAAACRDLVRLRDAAVWDGSAGDAFGARIGEVPTLLDRAARRHLGAAAPLRVYADVLEAEQALAQRCVETHRSAWEAVDALENRAVAVLATGRDEADPEVMVLRARQQDLVGSAVQAEQAYRAALDRLGAADARCARILRALADDELADPLAYRGLRTVSAAGHGVGALGALPARFFPTAAAVGVVGEGVGTAADATLLFGYGEGDGRALAVGVVGTTLGAGAGALKAGAKAGAVRRADGSVHGLSGLTAAERIAAGTREEALVRLRSARERYDVLAGRGTRLERGLDPLPTPVRVTPGTPLRRRVVEQVRGTARQRYDTVRGELALVAAGGPASLRMYGAGVTLDGASRALPKVADRQQEQGVAPGRPSGPTS